MALSKDEEAALATMESKLKHVRACVRGVVKEFHSGLFIHGEGGTSKSFTVMNELQHLKAAYVYHNTRLTGRGLVDSLERSPSSVHLIEDAETLLDDKKSFGVLRSALWSQSTKKPPERHITWTAFKTQISFTFTGGIIVISNVNLADTIPEIRAIKSRINVLALDISPEEIKALMTKICLEGHKYGELFLSPRECLDVKEYVVSRLSELNRNLDLRLLVNGFRDMLQYKQGETNGVHWHELLQGRMLERVVYKSRKQVIREKSETALEINQMKISLTKKLALAKEKGLSQAGYYRALGRTVQK